MKKVNILLYILAFSLISFFTKADISDTIHVSHYNISIDTVDYSSQSLTGNTELTVISKVNGLQTFPLSLYTLTVDSVTSNNQPVTFSYDNYTISITCPVALNLNDSLTLRVYYHGQPKKDATFGGFYFSGTTYAYNIGVGF